MHPRLINQLFENPEFLIDEQSLGYLVRDIINMNWWNTAGYLLGYKKNKRVSGKFTETQKRIAVQLKEYYRYRTIATKDHDKFVNEIRGYISGNISSLNQLGAYSMRARANPSQFFHTPEGEMTWVDCTSRATYAAKYVFQNGYIDFDGVCRLIGCRDVVNAIDSGNCFDLGIKDYFVEGDNSVKKEIFSQKNDQLSVKEWVDKLNIKPINERLWLLDAIGHVRTDPFKKYEAKLVSAGLAKGVNECLYGFKTSASFDSSDISTRVSSASHASRSSNASRESHASRESRSSHASNVSSASNASRASDASRASSVSDATHESSASRASNASRASSASGASEASSATDAGCTTFNGFSWAMCDAAITKPEGLEYPKVFRKNIFAIAGNWKIDKSVTSLCKIAWFDPFSGHGTTPLYCKRYGIKYLGFDTNKRAFDEYLNIINDELINAPGPSVKVVNTDSTIFYEDLVNSFDLCYTSPPYFDFEEYGGNTAHFAGCETYMDFHNKITIPVFTNVYKYLVDGGTLALQLEKNKAAVELWKSVIQKIGFKLVDEKITGQEKNKYSTLSKRDQSLVLFTK
jgi:hypothetical protein